MEYHVFLKDVTERSNALLGENKDRKQSSRGTSNYYHFTKKFIHLTFLMTMTFDRLRQVDYFEGNERAELRSLQLQYNSIQHMTKKDFQKSKSDQALNFKELFSLDTWFYYKHNETPPLPLPISIESLRKEDDKKAKISLHQLLSTIRNAVAHGQIDFGSKPGREGREINYIYFCSDLKGGKADQRTVIGRSIAALDESALKALIDAWHNFVLNSPELHIELKFLEKIRG